MREELLAKVTARTAAARGADPETVLSREALAEAVGLLAHRRPGGIDLEVLAAAGTLFFHRFLVQRADRRLIELVAAGQLLGPVYAVRPAAVPDAVRAFYAGGNDPWETFSRQTGFTTDPEVWRRLGQEPTQRYFTTDDLADLRLAVDLLRLARASATPDHPDLVTVANTFATLLSLLRAATHDPQDCEDAAEACRFVLARLRPGDPERSRMLGNHGVAALELARLRDDPALALAAVGAFRAGLRAGPDEDGGHGVNLGAALVELGRLTADDDPLYEALQVFQDVAAAAGQTAVNNLMSLLGLLTTRPAAEHARLAAFCRGSLPQLRDVGPADVPVLRTLCVLALQAGERDNDLDLLREAVTLGRRLLASAADDEVFGEAANNTASALRLIAQRTHDLSAARESVALARSAVGHSRRAARLDESLALGNLAAAQMIVFELTGDLEAQREGVHQSRLALAAPQVEDVAQRAALISTHAKALHRYAIQAGDHDLLREALATLRTARELPDLPVNQRVGILHGLTMMSTDLFALVDKEPVDTLREAVGFGEQARALIEPGDFSESYVLGVLVRARRLLGRAEGDADRLRGAIALADLQLAALSPDDMLSRLFVELERALALDHLAAAAGEPALFDEALAGLSRVVDSPHARPEVRMRAALQVVNVMQQTGGPAMDQLEQAVELLRLNVATGPLWADRENVLRNFSLLTGTIISTGLAAGDPARVIELLERSRGLLSEDAMDIRGDVHALDPAMAGELRQVSAGLRALDARDRTAPADFAARRDLDREIASERAELTRRWTELRHSAAPATAPPDLVAAAADGPVVMVASVSCGGYALLLTGDPDRPVRTLELPGLGFETANEQVLTFLTARHYATSDSYPLRVRRIAQAEVRDTLAWLWRSAAEPILTALGLDGAPGGSWPRLWWCPVGFLSYLPWHAAGSGAGEGVLDRVVSSYTASLRALEYVRRMPRGPGAGRTLIVAQPEAPGASPLRGVREEVAAIRRLVPGATLLAGAEATKATFLAALADHTDVHLACHAMTDVHSPGTSRLLLADHEAAPLSVAELAALHLPGRELAMLSACSTSEISPDLTDEALHLTAAFQLAGFRHVIGALWPVSDATAGEVSRAVYEHLTDGGRRAPHTADCALALHTAVRGLRERYAATPTVWASYVHTGA